MIVDKAYTGFSDETWELNPMQKLVFPYCDTFDNMVVAAETSSGKSTVFTMYGKKHIEANKAIIYTGPMKALVEEKRNDWDEEGHPWKEKKKVIVTGDYIMDDDMSAELETADIIVITPESLCSKLRRSSSEEWLKRVGLIGIDEIHGLGDGERGGTLEATMMELAEDHPQIQFLGLSATLPNALELRDWITHITNKTTRLVQSDYRPVKLSHHYIKLGSNSKRENEKETTQHVLDLANAKADQQFLVFVFNKAFGESLVEKLVQNGIDADFHSANKTKQMRDSLETKFRNGTLRVLVSTVTLAVGVNLPATNVIVTAVKSGGGDLKASLIRQCAGRAGRPKYDTEGHCYYMIPYKDFDEHVTRIQQGEPIISNMTSKASLAAHSLGALLLERFDTFEGYKKWFKRTFAYYQRFRERDDDFIEFMLNNLMEGMLSRNMVRMKDDKYVLTAKGKIVAQYLLDPYSFHDLVINLRTYFSLQEAKDIDIAKAFASVTANRAAYVTDGEVAMTPLVVRKNCMSQYYKHATVYYSRLTGVDVPYVFSNINYEVFKDVDRIGKALERVDAESERWGEVEKIKAITARIKHCCSWEEAKAKMQRFSKSDMKRLNEAGITTIQELEANPILAKTVLGPRKYKRS